MHQAVRVSHAVLNNMDKNLNFFADGFTLALHYRTRFYAARLREKRAPKSHDSIFPLYTRHVSGIDRERKVSAKIFPVPEQSFISGFESRCVGTRSRGRE